MASSTVSSGASQTITSGETSNAVSVASGAVLTVLSGGIAIDTAVSGQEVLSGGTDLSGMIASTGRQTIYSGGIASGTVISGVEIVSSGGVASAIDVSKIYGGGVSIGTVLLGPGGAAFPGPATEYVFAGGEAIGTTVSSGTADDVYGAAVNAAVAVGGQVFDSGTLSYSEAIGTAMTFAGVLTGGGNLVQSGPGSLTLTGDLAGYTGTSSISGDTLEVATPLLGATSIAFQAAASGRLQIDA